MYSCIVICYKTQQLSYQEQINSRRACKGPSEVTPDTFHQAVNVSVGSAETV